MQHRGIRGWQRHVASALPLAAGTGTNEVGRRVHQLLPSNAYQAYYNRALSGCQRK